ncbi:hypothetical protein FQA39_LY14626 [Lamprigera yunnana]|nr:hypothetical protein FQA39_LY14626 [Lamprigera yunnana]
MKTIDGLFSELDDDYVEHNDITNLEGCFENDQRVTECADEGTLENTFDSKDTVKNRDDTTYPVGVSALKKLLPNEE